MRRSTLVARTVLESASLAIQPGQVCIAGLNTDYCRWGGLWAVFKLGYGLG
jgi:hypothetical protein